MTKRTLATRAVHSGDRTPSGTHTPTTTPIHTASSFFYETTAELEAVFAREAPGENYSRYGNPTNRALEELVADLEGGDFCLATSSGMSALLVALLAGLIDRPKRVLAAHVLYGQSITQLMSVLGPLGVETRFVDPCDGDQFARLLADFEPSVVLVEPISNPLLRVAPLDAIADSCRSSGAQLVVDNTFATPVLLRPLELGAHMVVHSATKYLAGHGDVLGGVLVGGADQEPQVAALGRTIGPNLGPFEAYLTMRGIKTLPLRMEAHCRNALHIAEALKEHPRVGRVFYPGLREHPDRDTSLRLLPDGFGGMVSFTVKDADAAAIFSLLDHLQLIVPATTLGDVHSLILYPAMASHRDLSPKHRQRLGITDDLVRLSVGIESPEDVLDDLDQALEAVR